ncbi:hypothetical protein [Trinickia dinghuensis]|uniref:Uncharacterized protein n=1 Tax=Trinickia dinghuensis TaxID=2291023 RepID=A0A3D8K243_9BURK|nr:hypothetical protein [Trinickia dinghuensis]RDU99220.1 hypothetical protein DWV00_08835 [Trinickia dinghuensis]
MSVIKLSVRSNAKQLSRQLDAFVRKQLPYAVAQGINRTAQRVAEAESQNIVDTFKDPSPFTRKGVGVKKAKKGSPAATVFMKDVTAAYLKPYEAGGVHKLASRALLNPKDIKLNQYGQLARGTLATLRARPDVFIGTVVTSDGQRINGVWQRPTDKKKVTLLNQKGKRLGRLHKLDTSQNNGRGTLKLLIRFGDALPVQKRLGWGSHAQAVVNKWIDRDLSDALAAALATAR